MSLPRPIQLFLCLFIGLCAGSVGARAESLVADMSDRVIKISSNFTGSDIVIFGMIERDASTVSRGEPYDLVVVVRGWDETIVSRRKERVVGIWVNNERKLYPNAPNFYVLSSTRKLEDIANPSVLSKMQLGTDYLMLPPNQEISETLREPDPFRLAALRLKRQAGLYRDDLSSVTFLNDSLFRTTVDIPANVRVGRYDVTVHLFRGGALLSSVSQPLNIAKAGFEQMTFSLARNNSIIYGLLCVGMAMFMGWFAGVVFRRN